MSESGMVLEQSCKKQEVIKLFFKKQGNIQKRIWATSVTIDDNEVAITPYKSKNKIKGPIDDIYVIHKLKVCKSSIDSELKSNQYGYPTNYSNIVNP